jgi:hypothetical protein
MLNLDDGESYNEEGELDLKSNPEISDLIH